MWKRALAIIVIFLLVLFAGTFVVLAAVELSFFLVTPGDDQIFIDLRTRGLIKPKTPDTVSFLKKIKYPDLITKLGKQFLDFITSPIESKDEQKE